MYTLQVMCLQAASTRGAYAVGTTETFSLLVDIQRLQTLKRSPRHGYVGSPRLLAALPRCACTACARARVGNLSQGLTSSLRCAQQQAAGIWYSSSAGLAADIHFTDTAE